MCQLEKKASIRNYICNCIFSPFKVSFLSNPKMTEQWNGSIVSIDCGSVLGVFEGEISCVDVNNQTLSLINVSRNSIKCSVPEITLR